MSGNGREISGAGRVCLTLEELLRANASKGTGLSVKNSFGVVLAEVSKEGVASYCKVYKRAGLGR